MRGRTTELYFKPACNIESAKTAPTWLQDSRVRCDTNKTPSELAKSAIVRADFNISIGSVHASVFFMIKGQFVLMLLGVLRNLDTLRKGIG